jgi:NTE family protein
MSLPFELVLPRRSRRHRSRPVPVRLVAPWVALSFAFLLTLVGPATAQVAQAAAPGPNKPAPPAPAGATPADASPTPAPNANPGPVGPDAPAVKLDTPRANSAPLPAPGEAAAGGAARPRIAVVFSGGGARGFAEIGVLEVLQDLHVPIDIVAGTSMGAIVGGAYASGYSPRDLFALVAQTDWRTMFAGRAPRAEIDWRRKEDDFENLSNFEFGIRSNGLTLPQALVGSQGLELFLRRLGAPARDIRDLSQLPIPFVAMATDLTTGKPVVLQKDISLSTAMRASMAVPGAFSPLAVGGQLLVDGGLTANLPVDQALAMGADVIIAVDVTTPLLPREKLGDVVGVAEQLALLLGLDSKQRSIAKLRPGDILITPQLGTYRSADFADYDRIIEAGRNAARDAIDKLRPLAADEATFAAREVERTRLVRSDAPVLIGKVDVRPMNTVNPESVKSEIDIKPGAEVTTVDIERDIDRVYRTGDFEAVDYGIVGDASRRTLLIAPYEKSWGYNTLRFGGGLETNFREDNTFTLLAAHTWRWLDSWGAEWRNMLQIGEPFQISSELYQPLGPGSDWYLLPRVQRLRQQFRLYDGNVATSQFVNSENTAQLLLGHVLPGLGEIEAGFARSELSTTEVTGTPVQTPPPAFASNFIAHLRLDRLDTVNFPHRGYFFDAGATLYDNTVGSAEKRTAYTFEYDQPLTLGRTTAYFSLRSETAVQQSRVQLGGLFNLSGTPLGEISGQHGGLVRGIFYRNISDALGDIPMPIYAGFSLEAGNAQPESVDFDLSALRKAGSIFLGADSYIGPIYLAVGHTVQGSTAIYLLLGRPQ